MGGVLLVVHGTVEAEEEAGKAASTVSASSWRGVVRGKGEVAVGSGQWGEGRGCWV